MKAFFALIDQFRRSRLPCEANGLLICVTTALAADPVRAERLRPLADLAERADAAALEYTLGGAELDALAGRRAEVYAASGERLCDVAVAGFERGDDGRQILAIHFAGDGDRTCNVAAEDLARIDVEGRCYRPVFLPGAAGCAIEDATRRQEAIQRRLEKAGGRLWPEISLDDHAAAVEEYRSKLVEAQQAWPRHRLRLYETEYFLVLSDLDRDEIEFYVARLDAMSERLGAAFGYPPGHNVWRGKAVVVIFAEREDYQEFEHTVFGGGFSPTAQGLCHPGADGRVVVTCYRGDDVEYFACLLVHETSHGYLHRHLTDVRPPMWLSEGIAEWAGATTTTEFAVRRQIFAAQHLRQTGRLGGEFFSAIVPQGQWHYGAASALVDVLLQLGPRNFRLLVDGVKEGLPWEDSLDRAYGLSVDELCWLYGRTIGVPELAP